MTLSKSLYTRAIQCPKSLWLKKYKPNVLTPPDAASQAVFETGNIVGDTACELFPGGREVELDRSDYEGMMATTLQWMNEELEYIYEATFIYDGIVVMVDILRNTPEGVEIYEVKSSTEVKDIYLHDVSIQQYVLEKLGFRVSKSHVVHINNKYVRGDELDLNRLFSIVDVSDEVNAMQANIPDNLTAFEAYLNDRENEPDIEIGKQCKNPYDCDAIHYCWKVQRNIPEYSIFNIFNLGSKNQIMLYEQGIVAIEEIPDDFKMTDIQKQKVDNWKSQSTYIDKEQIRAFVETLTYPIYHLDFETFQQAIPQWKGISPFQQIPFQYSLHIEHEDGRIEHKEFLAPEGKDPRSALALQLVEDIPDHVTVLAYYMSFEKGVIGKLAEAFSILSDHLLQINENMKDLIVPFKKQYYVTPAMNGSSSIKQVLPAIVPAMEQAYKELDGIHNGGDAMNAYASLQNKSVGEREQIRNALLAYCKLDTLAMVKILEKLREVIDD